ncbi:hypothetical protein ABZ570_26750 [Micromonospora sp. NPDC007271]|uniref:hypothetical protein n=1 Tax=Micromonospora sp. NPDC007271 TaxID=3154587 RepID=UPI0033C49F89
MRKIAASLAKAGTGSASRRRFLGGVGASALATSAVLFGSAERASATYDIACCHLRFVPSVSVATCRSGCHYNWYCSTATKSCSCCEVKNCSTGAYTKSAYSCDNT